MKVEYQLQKTIRIYSADSGENDQAFRDRVTHGNAAWQVILEGDDRIQSSQIFNERREISFINLVIINAGFDFEPVPQGQDNRKTREYDIKRLIKENIRNTGSNSTEPPIIFSGMPGLVDAFPKLSDVKVRVDKRKKF